MHRLHRRIEDLLVEGEFATQTQIEKARQISETTQMTVVDVLMDQGVIDWQTRAAILRLKSVLKSMPAALNIAAGSEAEVEWLLYHSHQISRDDFSQLLKAHPEDRQTLIQTLHNMGVLDRDRLAALSVLPEQKNEDARAEAGIRLGDLLIEHGDITRAQLDSALSEMQKTGKRLGETLVDQGALTRSKLKRSCRLQKKLVAMAFGSVMAFSHAVPAAEFTGPATGPAAGAKSRAAQTVQVAKLVDLGEGSGTIKKVLKKGYPELRHKLDKALQADLNNKLRELGLAGAAKNGSLAVTLVDVTDADNPRMASVNGDNMMYAASLPKIAILLGAFEGAKAGKLKLDKHNREQLTRMIRNSSNTAATEMYHKVGPEYLAKVLQSDSYRLYDEQHDGGLWVGKEYGKGRAWKRDPINNFSHGATAMQTARFLYMMETGQLASPEYSLQMKDMMSKPAIKHKFVKGLESNRPGSKIYRKSGSWRNYHADCAIIERDGRRYIAVAIAEAKQGGSWLSRLIVGLDDVIFSRA